MFCTRCGAPAAMVSGEQRKRVTVLFCDVIASTALGERLDPETLHKVLGMYFRTATDDGSNRDTAMWNEKSHAEIPSAFESHRLYPSSGSSCRLGQQQHSLPDTGRVEDRRPYRNP